MTGPLGDDTTVVGHGFTVALGGHARRRSPLRAHRRDWLVDGTTAEPRFTALRLAGADYETVLDTGGRVELHSPLPVSFTVASLVRRR
ncbi:MAG TPA: hypothetical protein VFZ79_09455 [Acidimicrobiales bacterium]